LVVLELSSFQLEDLTRSPHIAIVLMITSEHLVPSQWQKNYHKDLNEYVLAKRNILRFQTPSDFAIVNRDYPASNESDIFTEGKIYYVSRERETENGCFVFGGKVIMRKNGHENVVTDAKDILLPGKHNYENVCAAVIAASLLNVKTPVIAQILKTFKGLPHRLELVRGVGGVNYYDDSFATNPDSTIAAIKSFDNPKVLILGGVTEGSDFSKLSQVIAQSGTIRAVVGIGKEWPRIKEEIQNYNKAIFMVEGAQTMEQIVKAAATLAQPHDVVLLSPACKSYDMFKNYKDRGEQFKAEVKKL